MEPELERARQLANAWSRGDVAGLRSLHRNTTLKEQRSKALQGTHPPASASY